MQRRQAFTIVELLVAMALTLFIMAILSQAFVATTQCFRDLKAAGDLAEKLRAVSIQLRRELATDHFEGKKRLSQPSFWDSRPPRQGFFRIYQGSRPRPGGLCTLEGVERQSGAVHDRRPPRLRHLVERLLGHSRLARLFDLECPWQDNEHADVEGQYSEQQPRGPIIQAIQVTIRIWDARTSLTRQITIVQAM